MIQSPNLPVDVDSMVTAAIVTAAMGKLWTLQEDFRDASPERPWELLQTSISRIDLQFEWKPQGKRMLTTLVSGRIELSSVVSRGDRTPVELFAEGANTIKLAARQALMTAIS